MAYFLKSRDVSKSHNPHKRAAPDHRVGMETPSPNGFGVIGNDSISNCSVKGPQWVTFPAGFFDVI